MKCLKTYIAIVAITPTRKKNLSETEPCKQICQASVDINDEFAEVTTYTKLSPSCVMIQSGEKEDEEIKGSKTNFQTVPIQLFGW